MFKRVSRLVATGAVSAALSVAGLTVTGPAADAATPSTSTTYTCVFPVIGAVDIPTTVALPTLPVSLPVGVPADLPVDLVLDLPTNVVAVLLALTTSITATVSSFAVQVGLTPVAMTLSTVQLTTLPLLADLALSLTGTLHAIIPAAGTNSITLPSSFNLTPISALGLSLGVIPCSLKAGAASSAGSVEGVKQKATMKASAVKKTARAGQHARIKVAVRNQVGKAAGKVVATLKGKTVGKGTLSNGKMKMSLRKLKAGSYRIKLAYLGDATTSAAKKTVRLHVIG